MGRACPYAASGSRSRSAPGLAPRIRPNAGTLRVISLDPADTGAVRAQLERWYRRLAQRLVPERVAALAWPSDGSIAAVTVRDQSTRWGSWTEGGRLSFNWRLVMAPTPVLDAVVVHELIHLRIPDHSPRFWHALDHRFPRHRACRRWLDYNAPRLHL